ncbi:MAG: S9 family peptidase [Bacillota bacterium]|nr:S9 family peptidase [Bacillota bacterium]
MSSSPSPMPENGSYKPLESRDFASVPMLSGPLFSPNSRRLVYSRSEARLEKDDYISHLWLLDTESGESLQLTNGSGEQRARWLDDDRLLFIARRQTGTEEEKKAKLLPQTDIWLIDCRGGEARLFLEIPLEVLDFEPLDEDTFLLIARHDPERDAIRLLEGTGREAALRKLKEQRDVTVLTELPFWSNGGSYQNRVRRRLYLYHRDTKALTPLSAELDDCDGLEVCRRTGRALLIRRRWSGLRPLVSELCIYEYKTGELREIGPFTDYVYGAAWFWGDDIAFSGSDMQLGGLNQDRDLWLLAEGSEPRRLINAEMTGIDFGNSVNSDLRRGGGCQLRPAGDWFYFIHTRGSDAHLSRVDKTGTIQDLVTAEGSVESFAVHKSLLIHVAFRGRRAGDLYRLDLSAHREERRLTDVGAFWEEERLGRFERFSFVSEGDSLEAFVLLPPDYDPACSYPALLAIHGGPKTAYGTILFHELQLLASHGYIVFFTNPRGSSGRGADWSDIRGGYGKRDYEQLMALTAAVLARYPAIDPERLGVLGGSYGGFMTSWIVTHETRFAAACTQRSISNWVSMYGLSDIGYYFVSDQLAATPWTDPERLWEASPLRLAPQVRTPTLILHSDQDYRCPLAEAQQFFAALCLAGTDARLVIFHGADHGLSRDGKPRQRLRRLDEILAWFDKYLKEQNEESIEESPAREAGIEGRESL